MNYGKVLAYSTGFLSKGKLDTTLLLPFPRSSCFQGEDYAQITGLSNGYCPPCHEQSNVILLSKWHPYLDQYIKHSSYLYWKYKVIAIHLEGDPL